MLAGGGAVEESGIMVIGPVDHDAALIDRRPPGRSGHRREEDRTLTPGTTLRFTAVALDDPETVRLTDAAQAFYLERYGGVDRTPVDPAEFAPPRGLFLLGCLGGEVACCGGWRRHTPETIGARDRAVLRPGDAEVKRMWVEPAHRRRGLARRLLAELERTAAGDGCRRVVLETGTRQPESIALYRAADYAPMPRFGVYRDDAESLCFARELPGGAARDPCG